MRTSLRIAVVSVLAMCCGMLGACAGEDAAPGPTPPSSASTSAAPTDRASTAAPTATPRASASVRPEAARTTLVTVRLSGSAVFDWNLQCFLTVDGRTKACGPEATLYSGSASWRVPTSLTRHLSLRYYDLRFDDGRVNGRRASVVMGYKGVPRGTRLTPAAAAAQTSASPCWAGTDQAKATLYVRAETVETSDGDRYPLVYTSPSAGASGGFVPTVSGGLVLAEPPVCD